MNRPLPNARHRMAALRNKLHAELAQLKSSSTKHKKTEGRLGGVMDCIQILDEEMLAGEQGAAQLRGMRASDQVVDHDAEIARQLSQPQIDGRQGALRPDQVAWLEKRRGGACQHEWEYNQIHDSRRCHKCRLMETNL